MAFQNITTEFDFATSDRVLLSDCSRCKGYHVVDVSGSETRPCSCIDMSNGRPFQNAGANQDCLCFCCFASAGYHMISFTRISCISIPQYRHHMMRCSPANSSNCHERRWRRDVSSYNLHMHPSVASTCLDVLIDRSRLHCSLAACIGNQIAVGHGLDHRTHLKSRET